MNDPIIYNNSDFLNKDVVCMEVIITTMQTRGKGLPGDPIRRITQVWTKAGELIAEYDPHKTVYIPKCSTNDAD